MILPALNTGRADGSKLVSAANPTLQGVGESALPFGSGSSALPRFEFAMEFDGIVDVMKYPR